MHEAAAALHPSRRKMRMMRVSMRKPMMASCPLAPAFCST